MSVKSLRKALTEATDTLTSIDVVSPNYEQDDKTVLTGGKAKYQLDKPESFSDISALKLGLKSKRASISTTEQSK